MMKRLIAICLFFAVALHAQEDYDLSTFLMKSTFKLSGKNSEGTCFIIGEPMKEEPTRARYVLVTAAHVLQGAKGDQMVMHLRQKKGDKYTPVTYSIAIRSKGIPLWVKHPDVDVAAMYVSLPKDVEIVLLATGFLATDESLKKYEIRPGDKLFALGFPLGQAANEAGFPILRAGWIAAYPILPTKATKEFLFDFEVFKGNSGGPVFMIEQNRFYGQATHFGRIGLIIGLVSAEKGLSIRFETPYESETKIHPLKLGVVIHASLIRETIELLSKK